MGSSISGRGTVLQFPWWSSVARGTREQNEVDVMTAELGAALLRIEALREENGALRQRQDTLVQEFERRLVNGLQVIESLLPAQGQTATSDAPMRQLTFEVCPWMRASSGHENF